MLIINPYVFGAGGAGGGTTRQAMVGSFMVPVYVNVSSREAVAAGPVMVNGGS